MIDLAIYKEKMEKVISIRGATTVSKNDREEIINNTLTLINELIISNDLLNKSISIINVIISSTFDIDACYPASAITTSGVLRDIPLFSTLEPKIKDSLQFCIRVMMTIMCPDSFVAKHVYLNEAKNLIKNIST